VKHKYIALLNAMLSSGLQALLARSLNPERAGEHNGNDSDVLNF